MSALFEYRSDQIYCHHSLDERPEAERFQIHVHETPEVYCFLSGSGSFLVEGTNYPLCPGDILLMRPAETHRLIISPSEPYERIAVHFPLSLFDSLDPARTLMTPFLNRPLGVRNRYPALDHPALFPLLSHLSPNRLQIISHLMQLLTELSSIRGAEEPVPDPAGDLPQQLVAYVNAHLFEEMSLPAIGDSLHRSVSQICRVFRRATGTSLWEYVVIKRLLAARELLRHGDSAVNAAFACGFSDYSSFYRAYVRRFGRAPGSDKAGRGSR